jgi:hypothetical protein
LTLALLLLVPASGSASIRLGVFNPGGPSNGESANAYLANVGRPADIAMWYHDFGHTLLTSEERAALQASGQTPLVTWEPYGQSLTDIAAGRYDSYVRESARVAKAWGGELMLRFAHEMNGDWYPWNGSPSAYVSAWQHLVTVFREEGVSNVRWVWAPNVDSYGAMPFSQYFPGEEWVDYVGLDGYNFGDVSDNRWRSLKDVFATSYATLTQLSSRPVIITETSSSEAGGDKAAWIREGFLSTIPQEFPRVAAVVWFNKSQEGDWRIDSSTGALEAFREVANCSVYGGPNTCSAGADAGDEEPEVDVSSIHVTPRVAAPDAKPRGTVSFRLTRRAKVRIKVQRRRGRHRYARKARRSRAGHRGRNRVPLRSLIRHRHLPRGSYRVVIVATDGNGHRSRPRTAHFRVVRR